MLVKSDDEELSSVTATRNRPRVAFVFAGQGAQWPGMGRELLRTETAFATALGECDALVEELMGGVNPW